MFLMHVGRQTEALSTVRGQASPAHFTKPPARSIVAAVRCEKENTMRPRSLAAALALSAALWLQASPAFAQFCDNLEGQEVKVSGIVDKMVEAAGVVFFRDRKTACVFGLVTHRTDRGCRVGAQIEVSGRLIKNKFLPDTYDIDRSGKPPAESLVCK
jgi:hypothetical protein